MPKTKYIIAMLAADPSYFVNFAQENFAGIAYKYLLGAHVHPHVTLVQFYGDEEDYVAVCEFLKTIRENPQPSFLGIEFGFDKSDPSLLWANLSVARDRYLLDLHLKLVALLENRKLVAINESKNLYHPHVTLALTKANDITCPKPVIPSVDFNLAIGIADEYGQFVEVKQVFSPAKVSSKLKLAKL